MYVDARAPCVNKLTENKELNNEDMGPCSLKGKVANACPIAMLRNDRE